MKNKRKIVTLEQNWHVITREREEAMSTDTTKVQLGDHWFLCDCERLLNGSRDESKTSVSPKPNPAQVTAYKTGNLEYTAQPADSSTIEECPFRWLSWSTPLQGSSFGLHLFMEEAPLVSASFIWFLTFKVSASSYGACLKVFVTRLRRVTLGILCLLSEGRT